MSVGSQWLTMNKGTHGLNLCSEAFYKSFKNTLVKVYDFFFFGNNHLNHCAGYLVVQFFLSLSVS